MVANRPELGPNAQFAVAASAIFFYLLPITMPPRLEGDLYLGGAERVSGAALFIRTVCAS